MLKNLSRRNFVRSLLGGAAVPVATSSVLASCQPEAPEPAGMFIVMGVNFEGDDPVYPAGEYLADGRAFSSEAAAVARAEELRQKWRADNIPEHYIGDFHTYPLGWSEWDDDKKYDYLMGLIPAEPETSPSWARSYYGMPEDAYSFWDTLALPFFVKELAACDSVQRV